MIPRCAVRQPSAWTDFIGKSEHGASCLGQLAGLSEKKDMYKFAVENLSGLEKTTIVLVARPDESSLVDAAQSYHREVQRAKGEIPPSVAALLPRLRDPAVTEAVIVALPEATPVMEASRLKDDLARAGIENTWWIANRCLSLVETDNPILFARAESEKRWLAKISKISAGNMVAVPWLDDVSPWLRAGICRSAASI